jgi:hypothetical protein
VWVLLAVGQLGLSIHARRRDDRSGSQGERRP